MTWVAVGVTAGSAVAGGVMGSMGRDRNKTLSETQQGSSGGTSQSQSTFVPNQSALPFYGYTAGQANNLMQSPVPFFPGQTYVGPSAPTQIGSALQMGAIPGMLGAAGQQGQAANTALGNFNFLSNAANVAGNPYVGGMADEITRRMNQNLMEQQLPALQQGAQQVNALGSSRLGVAQGQAMGRHQRELGGALAGLYNDAYGQGLTAQTNALGALGGLQQGMLAPSQTILGAGNVAYGVGQNVEGYQQKALEDAMARFSYQYQEPYQRLQLAGQAAGMLQPLGTQYGSASNYGQSSGVGTGANPNYQSAGQAFLGGAMTGASIGKMFSDRRLKRNVERIGTTPGGYPWYRFEYLWGEPGEGVMADEVPPDWVIQHPSGYAMVDYGEVQ